MQLPTPPTQFPDPTSQERKQFVPPTMREQALVPQAMQTEHPEQLEYRLDKHESKSRWMHGFLWLAILLLLIFLGRAFYESLVLHDSNKNLQQSVEAQENIIESLGGLKNLNIEQGQAITEYVSEDGTSYLCPAGDQGTNGKKGAQGEPGTPGANGLTGAIGAVGATGATGATGAQGPIGPTGPISGVNLDDAYNNFETSSAIVTVDAAEGQGDLRFNLTSNNFDIQDGGTTFASFDTSGQLGLVNSTAAGTPLMVTQSGTNPAVRINKPAGSTNGALDIYNQGTGFGIQVVNTIASSGDAITINQQGVGRGINILQSGTGDSLNITNTATGNYHIINGSNSSAATGDAVQLVNDGSGDGINLTHNVSNGSGAATAGLLINNTSTFGINSAIDITQGANAGSDAVAISNAGADRSIYIDQTNAANASNALEIQNVGLGDAIYIDNAGIVNSSSLTIDHGVGIVGPPGIVINWAANIHQRNAGGGGLVVSTAGSGPAARFDSLSTSPNYGMQVVFAENTTDGGTSAAQLIYANADDLVSDAALVGDYKSGILGIETDSEVGDGFNFIAAVANVDTAPDTKWRVDDGGSHYIDATANYNNAGADFAEYFLTSETDLAPGELVTVDQNSKNTVRRTTNISDTPIGIISETAGFIGNNTAGVSIDEQPDTNALVGLVGQIKVKTTDDNGVISIGDYLGASDTPGVAQKANAGDPVVGVALTNSDGSGEVTILLQQGSGGAAIKSQALDAKIGAVTLPDRGAFKDLTVINEIVTDKITALKDVEVQGEIAGKSLRIDEQASFGGSVKIAGHITVSKDTAGEITIKAQELSARYDFTTPYLAVPHIQLTPHDFSPAYRLETVTAEGFTISLKEATDIDLTFSWFAVESSGEEQIGADPDDITDKPADLFDEPQKQVNEDLPSDTTEAQNVPANLTTKEQNLESLDQTQDQPEEKSWFSRMFDVF